MNHKAYMAHLDALGKLPNDRLAKMAVTDLDARAVLAVKRDVAALNAMMAARREGRENKALETTDLRKGQPPAGPNDNAPVDKVAQAKAGLRAIEAERQADPRPYRGDAVELGYWQQREMDRQSRKRLLRGYLP
jgi:hypothetical protein